MNDKAKLSTISIVGLRIWTIIGINTWERYIPQRISIDVNFDTYIDEAVAADNIDFTVNYRALTKEIIKETQEKKFFLLETLAEYLLSLITKDNRIVRANIKVGKPGALRYAKTVSVYRETENL